MQELVKALNKMSFSTEDIESVFIGLNILMFGYGVEVICGAWHDHYWQDIVCQYVNMGETYETTILYDAVKNKWYATSWGDWAEKYDVKYNIK